MTKQNFIEEYTPIIKEFVESDKQSIKIPRVAIDAVDTVLFSLGYADEDFDSNGWQYDFWRYYNNSVYQVCLAGDAWYEDEFNLEKFKC